MKYIFTISIFLFTYTLTAQFQNSKNLLFTWSTDTTIYSVPLSEIQIVLPKGSFPTLDVPKFVGKKEGLEMFFSKEPVIVVSIGDIAKAYSLNILTMHEISNDYINGQPILVTYCPLCNSGIVYDRVLKHDGLIDTLEFEASGMLRNSDMVMLDRKTESLWQQLMGVGIVGEFNEQQLDVFPSVILSVEEFFERYPKGQIMSKNTGFTDEETSYGTNPYVGYDSKEKPIGKFFDSTNLNSRLPAMERVIDIKNGNDYKIYTFTDVSTLGVINDSFKGSQVVLFHQSGTVSVMDKKDISESRDIGTVTVFNAVIDDLYLTFHKNNTYFVDDQTKSKWDITGRCFAGKLKGTQLRIEPHSNHFAFAWFAFHPDSEIYEY